MPKGNWEGYENQKTKVIRIPETDYETLMELKSQSGVPARVLASRAIRLLKKDPSLVNLIEASIAHTEAEAEFILENEKDG